MFKKNKKVNSRRILVTSALPYANGPIHLGHLVEYIQTDIWVRTMRMHGHEIYYIGAEDAHGTAIMLKAKQENLQPYQLIEQVWIEHKRDFDAFDISFDNYYSTHSEENRVLSEKVYHTLNNANLIETREIKQAYDPLKEIFLPDRFIKGECPKCSAKDQYGDCCEVCGAIYVPTDLCNPYSVISGATPVQRNSLHYFFKLSDERCKKFLRDWVKKLAQPEATHKVQEWLGNQKTDSKISDWDISRDAPYFGFEIPNSKGKFFYVWLDAPIGYYASFLNFCKKRGLKFEEWVKPESETEQYHFIGKDILYFHALFWPAVLSFSGYRTPTNLFAHGFLTVNNQKMSKSRGTLITAKSYIDAGLNPEWLRYYFATKLNASIEDLNLDFPEFVNRINSDIIGKYVNIASRTMGFLHKYFDGRVKDNVMLSPLLEEIRKTLPSISTFYEQRKYSQATRKIMELADLVNAFIDFERPWDLAKKHHSQDAISKLHTVCSICIEAFRLLTIAIKPVMPKLARDVEVMFFIEYLDWISMNKPLSSSRAIGNYQHLTNRIDAKKIECMLSANLNDPLT